LPFGVWTYVAFTFEGRVGVPGTLRLYVNGSLVKEQEAVGSRLENVTGDFLIGAQDNWGVLSLAFKGFVDEIRVSTVVRGFEPCGLTVPVAPVSWGAIKALFR
jgi:hypothetical protein